MGTEILEEGVVRVRRPDAEWLRSVRSGAFAYEELLDQANAQLARLPALLADSPLPEEPDRGRAQALVVTLHEEFLAKGMGA